jgi:hypothetical protein
MVYVTSGAKVTKTGSKVSRTSGKKSDIYNVEDQGRTYPTTNPEFRPSTDPNKKVVEFNQGKGVRVSAGGQIFDLSKEEYGGQLVTPETMRLDQILAGQKEQAAQEVYKKEGAAAEKIRLAKGVGAVNAQKEAGIFPGGEQTQGTQTQAGTQEQTAAIPDINTLLTQQNTQEPMPQAGLLNPVGRVNEAIAAQKEPSGNILSPAATSFLGKAAEIYDSIISSVLSKKSTRVIQAEGSFADASAAITKNIEMVKTGAIEPSQVLRDFERATAAINRLERTTKGLGQVNLRYWIDNGAELEASIANEKAIIENQRDDLLAAIAARKLVVARANYGL